MLVVRELLLGPLRFSALRAALPGISAKVLTERLGTLEDAGVLVRRKLPPPAPAQVYELTEWGNLAEAPIVELGRWAARSEAHDHTLPLSPVALMLSIRSMVNADAARSVEETVGLIVAGQHFVASLSGGVLEVRRGEAPAGAAVLHAPLALPLLRVFYGHEPIARVEAEGGLTVFGDRAAAHRFARCFALPPKIG